MPARERLPADLPLQKAPDVHPAMRRTAEPPEEETSERPALPSSTKEERVSLNVRIPLSLHRWARMHAVRHDTQLQDVVRQALEELRDRQDG